MISQKTKYGLKAVIYLAKQPGQAHILITQIARAEKIPQKFLEAILLELRKKGYLKSKKGKGGGYALGKTAAQISIGDIVRVLEGPMDPVPCLNQNNQDRCRECRSEEKCDVKTIMTEVRDAVSMILDRTTLADVLERSQRVANIANFVI